jgi:homoserine kinase
VIRVTVPCSTSNLGGGFDCIGLALNRYLVATFTPGDELHLTRLGTLADSAGDDLVFETIRKRGIRGTLVLDSTIPVGKGLGSSAAATVAGIAIITALDDDDFDYDVALEMASVLEGHADNVAPALLGGLVGVVAENGTYRPFPLALSHELGFAFAAPNAIVSTKAARKALPAQVSHAIATRSIARGVALVEGLAEADRDLLRVGFSDELHVPYRLGMIPGGANALEAATTAGAWGATISGSGSGLIAVCEKGGEPAVRDAMADAFATATGQSAIAFVVEPDFNGIQIEKLS